MRLARLQACLQSLPPQRPSCLLQSATYGPPADGIGRWLFGARCHLGIGWWSRLPERQACGRRCLPRRRRGLGRRALGRRQRSREPDVSPLISGFSCHEGVADRSATSSSRPLTKLGWIRAEAVARFGDPAHRSRRHLDRPGFRGAGRKLHDGQRILGANGDRVRTCRRATLHPRSAPRSLSPTSRLRWPTGQHVIDWFTQWSRVAPPSPEASPSSSTPYRRTRGADPSSVGTGCQRRSKTGHDRPVEN